MSVGMAWTLEGAMFLPYALLASTVFAGETLHSDAE